MYTQKNNHFFLLCSYLISLKKYWANSYTLSILFFLSSGSSLPSFYSSIRRISCLNLTSFRLFYFLSFCLSAYVFPFSLLLLGLYFVICISCSCFSFIRLILFSCSSFIFSLSCSSFYAFIFSLSCSSCSSFIFSLSCSSFYAFIRCISCSSFYAFIRCLFYFSFFSFRSRFSFNRRITCPCCSFVYCPSGSSFFSCVFRISCSYSGSYSCSFCIYLIS